MLLFSKSTESYLCLVTYIELQQSYLSSREHISDWKKSLLLSEFILKKKITPKNEKSQRFRNI